MFGNIDKLSRERVGDIDTEEKDLKKVVDKKAGTW